jgi:glycosyltransferase involved in cell wall biosynthesis
MPLISILIPSYNHARYMRTCLATVRSQTFRDWEVILLDDGSTDDSLEVAEAIAAQDRRIRVERNPQNLGTYGTEQRALDMAQSPYIAILNSDDLWHPEKLEKQVTQLESEKDLALSYTLGWVVDENTQTWPNRDVHSYWPKEPKQDVIPYLLFENRILASSVLFRREGLRFDPSLRYSGDWVALLERARKPVGCVPERLSYWRVHGRNTFTLSEPQMLEEIRVRHAIHDQRRLWDDFRLEPHWVDWGLSRNAMNLAACHLYFGDRAAARKWGLIGFAKCHSVFALKRLLVTLLPSQMAIPRLWRDKAKKWTPEQVQENTARLRSLPPLEFKAS